MNCLPGSKITRFFQAARQRRYPGDNSLKNGREEDGKIL